MTPLKLVKPKIEKTLISRRVDCENPVTRCSRHGAQVLSLRECLSVILQNRTNLSNGTRLASKLLRSIAPGMREEDQMRVLFTRLESATAAPTPELGTLSQGDEARIMAVFELARRYYSYRDNSKGTVPHKRDVSTVTETALGRIGHHWRSLPVEWLGFVPIYKKKVGNLCIVERGLRTHVNTDPAELFARILALRPIMIILCHNHPSGELTPSLPDLELTRQVNDLCRKFGIKMLSHWIVSGVRESEVPLNDWRRL